MKATIVQLIFMLIGFLFYILILLSPFVLAKKLKNKNYIVLLIASIGVSFMLLTLAFYWSEELSAQLIYNLYGFDPHNSLGSGPWTKEISEVDKETIINLYNGSFGMGWAFKLILFYISHIIPYNFTICGLIYLYKRKKRENLARH